MRYLSQGFEAKTKILLLLSLTKISSENIKTAIVDHLCLNFTISDSASINNCKQSNLTHALNSLNKVACIVEKINCKEDLKLT